MLPSSPVLAAPATCAPTAAGPPPPPPPPVAVATTELAETRQPPAESVSVATSSSSSSGCPAHLGSQQSLLEVAEANDTSGHPAVSEVELLASLEEALANTASKPAAAGAAAGQPPAP
eukprot:12755670-Alexandrium_andersonii.AAC.1